MFWHYGWMHGGWHRRMWRRHYWGMPGCGCLPMVMVIGLLFFVCLITMCSGPHYYGY